MITISRKEWFENHIKWNSSVELFRINIENVSSGRLKLAIFLSLFIFLESGSWSAHRYKEINTNRGILYDYNQ